MIKRLNTRLIFSLSIFLVRVFVFISKCSGARDNLTTQNLPYLAKSNYSGNPGDNPSSMHKLFFIFIFYLKKRTTLLKR